APAPQPSTTSRTADEVTTSLRLRSRVPPLFTSGSFAGILARNKGLSCLSACPAPTIPRGVTVTYRSTAARALIAVGALTVLAACGSGSSGSSSGGTTGGAVHGGNLVLARTADSQSMNKTTVFDNESIWIFEQIMEPLYTVTPNGKGVQPWLATSYTVSPDKKTYTFTLRKGVKFSNGKPLTSADV